MSEKAGYFYTYILYIVYMLKYITEKIKIVNSGGYYM